jgi:hypothetical protein
MAHKLMQVGAGFALLYAARQFYRNWGTTKEECRMTLPGDELIRRGLYCYQTLENWSARTITTPNPSGVAALGSR